MRKESTLKKVLAAIAAALTSPEVVTAEKNMAVLALTRLAVLLPGAAIAIDMLIKALS